MTITTWTRWKKKTKNRTKDARLQNMFRKVLFFCYQQTFRQLPFTNQSIPIHYWTTLRKLSPKGISIFTEIADFYGIQRDLRLNNLIRVAVTLNICFRIYFRVLREKYMWPRQLKGTYRSKKSILTFLSMLNQLFCLVRTGANFAIVVEMTKFKFIRKTKKASWFDGQILSGARIKHNQKTTLRLWSTL